MNENSLLEEIGKQFGIMMAAEKNQVSLDELAEKINDLLLNDFQKLVSILYRMDINESKLRRLLNENQNTDAGLIIANLMVEREMQKIKSREASRKKDHDLDEEEKW